MAKKRSTHSKILNRRARYDYTLKDEYIAGLVLSGAETKSLRRGRGQLSGAYVTVQNNEPYLINAVINGDSSMYISEENQTRTRKLLLRKKQINTLIAAKQQGFTLVPIEFITNGRYIKLKFAIGKGKKLYDKRETIKKREQTRQVSKF